MSQTFIFFIFLLLFPLIVNGASHIAADTIDQDETISPSTSTESTEAPSTPSPAAIVENAKELLENLKNASEFWLKFQFNSIINNGSKTTKFEKTINETYAAFYNVFKLGEDIYLKKWIKEEKSANNPNIVLIKNATSKVVSEIEKMDQTIAIGLSQLSDESIASYIPMGFAEELNVYFNTLLFPITNETIAIYIPDYFIDELSVSVSNIKSYLQSLYQDNLTINLDGICLKKNSSSAGEFDGSGVASIAKLYALNNSASDTLNFLAKYDPLNDQLFIDTANMFIADIKQIIMINAACDVVASQSVSINEAGARFGPFKDDIKAVLSLIDNLYFQRKIDFNQTINSTITYGLSIGKGNSEISQNIYFNISTTYYKYNFAVTVYDSNQQILNPRAILKGNVYIVPNQKGKHAFVIPNRKPSAKRGYTVCEFWKLNEMEICSNATEDNFYKIIDIIQQKCNWITDIAVIKMIPHSLNGYVSPKFDPNVNAFSVSGIGLGDCFHYSIWIANKLSN